MARYSIYLLYLCFLIMSVIYVLSHYSETIYQSEKMVTVLSKQTFKLISADNTVWLSIMCYNTRVMVNTTYYKLWGAKHMTFSQCLVARGHRQLWKRHGAWGNVLLDMYLPKYSPIIKTNWIKFMKVLESKIWHYILTPLSTLISPPKGDITCIQSRNFRQISKEQQRNKNIYFYLNVSYFVHHGLFAWTLICFPIWCILITKWFVS